MRRSRLKSRTVALSQDSDRKSDVTIEPAAAFPQARAGCGLVETISSGALKLDDVYVTGHFGQERLLGQRRENIIQSYQTTILIESYSSKDQED